MSYWIHIQLLSGYYYTKSCKSNVIHRLYISWNIQNYFGRILLAFNNDEFCKTILNANYITIFNYYWALLHKIVHVMCLSITYRTWSVQHCIMYICIIHMYITWIYVYIIHTHARTHARAPHTHTHTHTHTHKMYIYIVYIHRIEQKNEWLYFVYIR